MQLVKEIRRKVPLFYQIYIGVLLILGIAAGFVLRYLYFYLADFEAAQPKYVAEKVAETFISRDFNAIYGWTLASEQGEKYEAKYVDFWRRTLADPVTFEEAYSPSEEVKKYNVYAAGKKFANFSLKPSGTKSRYGFAEWAFDSAECCLLPTITEYTIRTDDQGQVYVNDALLSEGDVIDSPVETEKSWLSSDQTIVNQYKVYSYPLFEGEPALSLRVQSAGGVAYPVVKTGDTSYEAIPLPYDDAAKESNTEVSVLLAEKYALFMSGNLSKNSMLRYLKSGTAFAKSVKKYDTRWFKDSVSRKFENVAADHFIPLNDRAYTCEVSFDFTEKGRDGNVRTSPTTYKLYVVMDGGKWKIFNIELLASTSS